MAQRRPGRQRQQTNCIPIDVSREIHTKQRNANNMRHRQTQTEPTLPRLPIDSGCPSLFDISASVACHPRVRWTLNDMLVCLFGVRCAINSFALFMFPSNLQPSSFAVSRTSVTRPTITLHCLPPCLYQHAAVSLWSPQMAQDAHTVHHPRTDWWWHNDSCRITALALHSSLFLSPFFSIARARARYEFVIARLTHLVGDK